MRGRSLLTRVLGSRLLLISSDLDIKQNAILKPLMRFSNAYINVVLSIYRYYLTSKKIMTFTITPVVPPVTPVTKLIEIMANIVEIGGISVITQDKSKEL